MGIGNTIAWKSHWYIKCKKIKAKGIKTCTNSPGKLSYM